MSHQDYDRDADDIQDLADEVNRIAEQAEEPPEVGLHDAVLLPEAEKRAPFGVAAPAIRRTAETEDLLNGLIAECHYLMREVAMPSAANTPWVENRNNFLRNAMNLAETGATVAGAIAKLRIADRVSPEAQGRIIDAVAKTIAGAR